MSSAAEFMLSQIFKHSETVLNLLKQEKENELKECTPEVKALVKSGVELARKGEFDEALVKFATAASKDPTRVGVRFNLIKLYKAQGKDLKALVMGGYALALTDDELTRSKVNNVIGVTCRELAMITKEPRHFDQALSFYRAAQSDNKHDPVPVWNQVESCLLACQKVEGLQEEYSTKAASALEELLALLRTEDVERTYVPGIIADSIKWQSKEPREVTGRFSEIHKMYQDKTPDINVVSKTNIALGSTEEPTSVLAKIRSNWGKALLVATLISALLGVGFQMGSTVSTTPDPPGKTAPEKVGPTLNNDSDAKSEERLAPYSKILFKPPVEGSDELLAAVEHDYELLTAIEHDWDTVFA